MCVSLLVLLQGLTDLSVHHGLLFFIKKPQSASCAQGLGKFLPQLMLGLDTWWTLASGMLHNPITADVTNTQWDVTNNPITVALIQENCTIDPHRIMKNSISSLR